MKHVSFLKYTSCDLHPFYFFLTVEHSFSFLGGTFIFIWEDHLFFTLGVHCGNVNQFCQPLVPRIRYVTQAIFLE